ncbi:unnamed protein product [Rotaria sordida]|uniref:Uncharacterized protein n=1 Tax=Rotaria sordida TaxID=392033 RepID=A0A814HQX4_9BILA|nr:unnamed protein product [Rotaria sordida]CAF1012975.1 unnamed protein product [Rotaria sordida]CAF1205501.1 unnamed protein product [Rotaria sordida]CAF3477704.1 unnamed protein product [Rotaria sordida]CAF3615843.1 unnamed protein product [Rotaria sordida]
MGLKLYRSHPLYNPVTYSLLNILIHNKQAKAFVSDEAIEMALDDIKEFDQKAASNNEPLLRQLIYGTYCKSNEKNCVRSNRKKVNHVSSDLAQQISLALDEYSTDDNPDRYQTITVYNGNKD